MTLAAPRRAWDLPDVLEPFLKPKDEAHFSRPLSSTRCKRCTSAALVDERYCAYCLVYLRLMKRRQRKGAAIQVRQCVGCGCTFETEKKRLYCSPRCRRRAVGQARHHGMTLQARNELVASRDYRCCVCGEPFDGLRGVLPFFRFSAEPGHYHIMGGDCHQFFSRLRRMKAKGLTVEELKEWEESRLAPFDPTEGERRRRFGDKLRNPWRRTGDKWRESRRV